MIVVADASPFIALARIGRLELLRTVFGKLLLPEAVWREVVLARLDKPGSGTLSQADWIERRSVVDAGLVSLLRRDLGAGEAEAIALAREAGADLVLSMNAPAWRRRNGSDCESLAWSACSSKRGSAVCSQTRKRS